MASVDCVDEVVLDLRGQQLGGLLHRLHEELDVLLDALELILDEQALILYQFLQRLHLVGSEGEHDLCLERDGVAHVATMPYGQASAQLLHGLADEAHHLLVGVGAATVDLQARVATKEALQRHADCRLLVVGDRLILQFGGDVNATSRTDDKLAPEL